MYIWTMIVHLHSSVPSQYCGKTLVYLRLGTDHVWIFWQVDTAFMRNTFWCPFWAVFQVRLHPSENVLVVGDFATYNKISATYYTLNCPPPPTGFWPEGNYYYSLLLLIETWFKFSEPVKGIVTIHYLVNLRDLMEISRGRGSVKWVPQKGEI